MSRAYVLEIIVGAVMMLPYLVFRPKAGRESVLALFMMAGAMVIALALVDLIILVTRRMR